MLNALAALIFHEHVDLRLLEARPRGSLFANFTFDSGSHITIDLSPEPVWLPWLISSSVWN